MFLLQISVSLLFEYVLSETPSGNYDPEILLQMPGYGESWMYMPDGNGNPRIAYLEIDNENPTITTRISRKISDDVTFDLYTRKNPDKPQKITVGDPYQLNTTNIDFNKPIKIITHGWMSSNKSDICQMIKNKYLQAKNYNIIIADWAPISRNVFYFLPMMDTIKVGRQIAHLLDFLRDNGADFEQVHLIGHSLGAHVCGYAGLFVEKGQIGRITGLDPAMPGFQMFAGNNHKLDASDAKFVDVIHTCGGALGYSNSLGHVDFYPNGGTPSQPGCFGLVQFLEACSHGRAWEYFAESIGNPNAFPSIGCESWSKFKEKKCKKSTSVPMGEAVHLDASGDFYLRTSNTYPFHAI